MATRQNTSKKRKRRRRRNRAKVYFARFIALIIALAAIAAIIFGGRKLFEKAKDLMPAAKVNVDESCISVSSKGKITGSIVEDFDENVYNADELKAMVDQEIADYDKLAGTDNAVALDNFEIKDGKAVVSIKYDSCEDYRSFNNTVLYQGKVEDVADAGVLFDKELKGAGDNDGILAGNISSIKSLNAVVLSEKVAVSVPGKIQYYSAGVELLGDKSAKVLEDSEGNAFIIYK